jgi:hypothetical protein
MNKSVYVYLSYKDDKAKADVFYPTKQHTVMSYEGNKIKSYSSLLNSVLDYIQSLNLTLPVIIGSNEVIITNILNEKKETNLEDWKSLLNNLNSKTFQVRAYTF